VLEADLTDRDHVKPVDGSIFKEGMEIIVAGQTGLKDGAMIRLTPQEPEIDGDAKVRGGPHGKKGPE
jgi:hypothetical protein